jgi:6-pyruvoyltetrahydropterin/6-carboxytetrahydropterin synthase
MERKLLLHTETTIDSAHQLIGYDGKCKNIHGHSFFIEIFIQGLPSQLDKDGILFDFGRIKDIKEKYDHHLINEIPPFDKINPTAEHLVQEIYLQLRDQRPDLEFCVRLYETKVGKETWVMYGDFQM